YAIPVIFARPASAAQICPINPAAQSPAKIAKPPNLCSGVFLVALACMRAPLRSPLQGCSEHLIGLCSGGFPPPSWVSVSLHLAWPRSKEVGSRFVVL